MKFFDIDRFKEILDTLTRNKGRSLLTGFGVFWGNSCCCSCWAAATGSR